MKHKTSLVLMEQLVMVLVFALAAAMCLGAFSTAYRISRETRYREEGALLAQNAAELLKSGEDLELLDMGQYRLEVQSLPSSVPGYLNQVQIRVLRGEETVFLLETGWQEDGP